MTQNLDYKEIWSRTIKYWIDGAKLRMQGILELTLKKMNYY